MAPADIAATALTTQAASRDDALIDADGGGAALVIGGGTRGKTEDSFAKQPCHRQRHRSYADSGP